MGYYEVLSAPRGGKRHLGGLDGNTCPTVNRRARYTFWQMGEHTSLQDMATWVLRPTCRYCVAAAERAIESGTD